EFLTKTDMMVPIRGACRPAIGLDPVMFFPAAGRLCCCSRLVGYRMGWLPGEPRPC
ncbi:hypothetical protein FB192DRAFT_1256325, partial [Mucor lusitanicus]